MTGRVAGREQDGHGLFQWDGRHPRERMSPQLLCSGECRSGSPASSAKPPEQPPRLSEKKADSEMCGLNREIRAGRGGRDNSHPGAGIWATAWGSLCPPSQGASPTTPLPLQDLPGRPAQRQALMCAWSRRLYFKIRAQTSK